jgi:cytochrome c oxidase cbb3-type subunit 3
MDLQATERTTMPQDQLLDHEYDGIQEYDNPCPGWWHAIFWLTVVFSAAYFLFFHVGYNGWTVAEAWQTAAAEDQKKLFGTMGDLHNNPATILTYMDDTKWMNYAKNVFLANCQSCHGPDGGGVVGPNLTDDYYKNVNKITDIAEVVKNGAAGGSMPAWKTRLHPNEVILMAAYVARLRGKPVNGQCRPPEGKPIERWPTLAEVTGAKSKAKPGGASK